MVFGGGGQVGRHLIELARATGHDLVGLTHEEADICRADAVAKAIAKHSPKSIVNAAAYTAVDKAESEAMRAFAVNRDGTTVVTKAAAKASIPPRLDDRLRRGDRLSQRLHRRRAAVAHRCLLEEHLLRAVSRDRRP
jgi:dTDP-D-glucose 4,6-dehydratase